MSIINVTKKYIEAVIYKSIILLFTNIDKIKKSKAKLYFFLFFYI